MMLLRILLRLIHFEHEEGLDVDRQDKIKKVDERSKAILAAAIKTRLVVIRASRKKDALRSIH